MDGPSEVWQSRAVSRKPEADEASPLPSTVASGITVRDDKRTVSGTMVGANERQTTPAPPTAANYNEGASRFPTPAPTSHFAVMAEGASLRHESSPRLPMDIAVPVRTATRAPDDLPHRLAFLLLVVDGHASIADIAKQNDLPIEDVLAGFIDLLGAGLIELSVGR